MIFIFREFAVVCAERVKRVLSRAPVGRLRSPLQHNTRNSYNYTLRQINREGRAFCAAHDLWGAFYIGSPKSAKTKGAPQPQKPQL